MLKRSTVPLFAAGLLSAALGFWPAAAGAAPLDDARSRVSSGDVNGAIAALEPYVAANPGDRATAEYLGDLYFRASDWSGAERVYSAILHTAPDDKEVHDRLGNVYAAQDRVGPAIDQYQLSLPDAVGYADLVRLHTRIGDLAQFVASYRSAADADTDDLGAQFAYGLILRDLHRPSEALPYAARAVSLAPQSCPAQSELGNVYLDLHQPLSASGAFRQCLAIDPNYYPALVDLSSTYDPVADARAARGLLQRAVALRPDRPEAFVNLGYVDDAGGNMASAMDNYRKALARDVLCRDAYVDLGYDYQAQGQFLQAESAYLKGLSVSPSDGRLEYLLGRTYAVQGKRDLARQQFANAAKSDDREVATAASHVLTTY